MGGMKQKMIILSGTYKEYRDYIKSHEHTLRDFDTIHGDFHGMAGIQADGLITIGTFWSKEKAKEIYDYASTRVIFPSPKVV